MNRLYRLHHALALLLPALLGSCALMYRNLEEPDVRLVSVTPQQIGFSGIRLLCRLRVDNPNDVSLPVRAGKIALEVEGRPLARGVLVDGFTVGARDSELVDAVVDVDSASSLSLAIQLLGNGKREFDYVLTGHIDIAIGVLGRVYIEERGVVPLTRESSTRRDERGPI